MMFAHRVYYHQSSAWFPNIPVLISLLSIGNKMPGWVTTGYEEYARRLTGDCRLELREISQIRQGTPDLIREKEGQKLLRRIPKNVQIVALDVLGQCWDSQETARHLNRWKAGGRDVCLLVGGPEGLSSECLNAAHQTWSLSPLTFPHPLVRVVVAEQIYRADTILRSHPYHRA